jgi:hypothetical protein
MCVTVTVVTGHFVALSRRSHLVSTMSSLHDVLVHDNVYIYIYMYVCICLRSYEVLEYDEYKLDKKIVKRTYSMLNIYIGV